MIPVTQPPPAALAVSPARLALVAPASRRIELRNAGAEQLAVVVTPRLLTARHAAPWAAVRPAKLVLRSGARAVLTLRVRGSQAPPGDHQLRILFTGQPLNGGRVGIRLRLAVGLRVRVPGRITRFVDIRDVRARRSGQARLLLVSVVNRGNVTESLAGRVSLVLLRRGRVISRLRARERRDVFPGAHAVLALRYRGHATGLVTAVATVALGDGIRRTERRYRLRL